MNIPKKPKLYKLRLYLPYIQVGLFVPPIIGLDTVREKILVGVVFLIFLYIVQRLFNPKEVDDYRIYEMALKKQELIKSNSNSNVNESIAKYLEEQRIKKCNSKWWQFWV